MESSSFKVKCPSCKKETVYSTSNIFRPFCSERCKLIDLGAWASGKHAIPAEKITDQNPEVEEKNDLQYDSDDQH